MKWTMLLVVSTHKHYNEDGKISNGPFTNGCAKITHKVIERKEEFPHSYRKSCIKKVNLTTIL